MTRGREGIAALLAVASLTAGSPAPACAQEAAQEPRRLRLLPVDEAARDPAFFAFRASLQRAIAERDTAALLAVVHPEIKLSFGGEHGIASFREMWLADTASGAASLGAASIWAELGAVLALGGRFYGDSTFAAPYTFMDLPDEVDPFEALIAIADSVPVHAAPDTAARILDVLSFEIVTHDWRHEGLPPEGWIPVRLEDGMPGYVRSRQVRSPIYFRAIFSRRDGRWTMSIFVAGD